MPAAETGFWIGALAGLGGDAIVHPLDTLRARLQVSSATLSKTGARNLYSGFWVVVAGTVPGHALYFGGYEWAKQTLGAYANQDFKPQQVAVHLTSGLIADVMGSLAWTPMDVVK